MDQDILAVLQAGDIDRITRMPLEWFNGGNSEIRNWVVTAAAVEQTDLRPHVIDYVPCYRSEAGTGCAMAFAEWV